MALLIDTGDPPEKGGIHYSHILPREVALTSSPRHLFVSPTSPHGLLSAPRRCKPRRCKPPGPPRLALCLWYLLLITSVVAAALVVCVLVAAVSLPYMAPSTRVLFRARLPFIPVPTLSLSLHTCFPTPVCEAVVNATGPPTPSDPICPQPAFHVNDTSTPISLMGRFYPPTVAPVRTFLISFPRSGSTMTRSVIEEGTGVWVGSEYPEVRAQLDGSLTRGVFTSHVDIVKTHLSYMDDDMPPVDLSSVYDPVTGQGALAIERYIYVMRHPMDVLVSWYQFRRSWDDARKEVNTATAPLMWEEFRPFLFQWLPIWAAHVRYFTATFLQERCQGCETLVVRYEDVYGELGEIDRPVKSQLMCFLGYPAHRQCRPSDTTWYYKDKQRRSLFNASTVLARDVSYAAEIFPALNASDVEYVEMVAGYEMRTFGYWMIPGPAPFAC